MADFKIGFPDIPWSAVVITASSEDADYPVENLFYGNSSLFWKTASAVTSSNITFDLGSGNTRSPDYCYIRGLRHLSLYISSIEIRASTDNFGASNVLIHTHNPIVFVGNRLEDCMITWTPGTAYRYWRVVFNSTSTVHKIRKLYLGNLFSFENGDGEIDPSYPYLINYENTSKGFSADNGSIFKTSVARPQKMYSFKWKTITDTSRVEFENSIGEKKDDAPMVLYYPASGDSDPLSGAIAVLAWVKEMEISSGDVAVDTNIVDISFLEDII